MVELFTNIYVHAVFHKQCTFRTKLEYTCKCMVAYFCHHLSDKYVVVFSDLYVDLSDHYVDLSENYIELSDNGVNLSDYDVDLSDIYLN